MLKTLNINLRVSLLLLLLLAVSGCVSLKNISYVNDINQLQEPYINPRVHKLIMPFNKLYVKVYSIDEKTNTLFSANESMSMNSTSGMIGYFVDETGNINFPLAGKIHVAGLSVNEASTKIFETLNEYVPTTSVIVRFIENQISVIGEVSRPGTYTFSQDKINIYDALALGGGIGQFGSHKKVILVRQDGDKIVHYKLDLTDSRISGKDFYYIQANDVIIVEPLRTKILNYGTSAYSLVLSSISSLIAIILFLRVV
jgi:polysaccharide biosynthesis/export protein